jgi:hypothetical protein
MIENVVGTFQLPLGVAGYFQLNGRDVLVPMAVEEPRWWPPPPSWPSWYGPAAASRPPAARR